MAEGTCKELAIVLSESGSDAESTCSNDLVDDEPIATKGSPLKVLPASKYRKVIDVLNCSSTESDGVSSDDDDECIALKARKKLKFEEQEAAYEGDQLIYEYPPAKYTAEQIIKILLDPNEEKICHVKPTSITKSATYVVDVRSLQNIEDIKKDEFGIWNYSGSHPQVFKVYTEDDGHKTIEKCSEGASGSNVVYLRRLHCTYPSNSDFKRLICFLSDASQRPHHLCLLVYRFPPSFVPRLSSHGNSKEKRPFFLTWPSTRDLIKKQCLKQGPKETVERVSSEVGGVVEAAGPGQLPRSEKQVTNIRRTEKLKHGYSSDAADDLFVIMQRAHTEDPSSQFIRGIRTAPDPAIVLTYDFQLKDMVRFCTSSTGEFCILTIDPTFSLGEFDVTPITYRHLLLESRRSNSHPICLGPVLVHYRKTFAAYLFFASTLVGLSRQLQGVRAFGTDGEQALADAFGHEFAFSQRLICFIHMRRNVKERCSEFNVPPNVSQKILDDIFGAKLGSVLVEGLVDASDDTDFQNKLDDVVLSWQHMSVPSSCNLQAFIDWFLANKSHVIRDNMLRPIREECGLGCPPEPFTTNTSESINAMLKRKVNYKRSELPTFVDKVKELIKEQQKEVERAVIGRGKYKLKYQYQSLEVPESKWFVMTSQQRNTHLSKLQSAALATTSGGNELDPITLMPPHSDEISTSHIDDLDSAIPISSSALSIDVHTAAVKLNIPLTCLEGIWEKAKQLITTEGAIALAPGQDPQARMVLSYSGKAPHMVTPKKGGGFSCDSSCPNWKALGVCSHSVAVAEINGQLAQFLSSHKRKKAPNVTNLLTTNMPKGRGRKGGTAPRVRKASQPVATRIEMNTSTFPAATSCVQSTSTSHAAPNVHFSPTAMAPQYNVLHSPLYGGQQMYHPYLGYQEWGLGYSHLPYQPPPFASQYRPLSPFTLCFIAGNISSCFGCKAKYLKSLQPPADLCFKHQDWREFVAPNTGTPQSKFGNVYYHCKPECVWMRCTSFVPSELQVSSEIAEKLSSVHKEYLLSVFGLRL